MLQRLVNCLLFASIYVPAVDECPSGANQKIEFECLNASPFSRLSFRLDGENATAY